MDSALSWVFRGVTWVISLLSAIISQDAIGAPRSLALMSEFISCCSAPATPEDPPFCNMPDDMEKMCLSLPDIACKCEFFCLLTFLKNKLKVGKPLHYS